MTTNSCRNSSPAGTARVGLPSRSRPTLAPPVLICGKQIAQRFSIRFPKREGQSRISIRFVKRPLVKFSKQASGCLSKCFQVFLSPSLHVPKHGARNVGKIRISVGEIRNV